MSDHIVEQPAASKSTPALVVGELYDGTVLKVKPFGAIISLPDSPPGLVHISQIANGFIQSVEDVLAVGDEVLVRVTAVDVESGKISLTMKDVPQFAEGDDSEDGYYTESPVVISPAQAASFEEKLKSWQKLSSDRIAGINRRNKRRK